MPCRRCHELGLEASCRYLPRKKRTNFKKRKQPDHQHGAVVKIEDDDPAFAPVDVHTKPVAVTHKQPPSTLVDHEAALRMEELRRNPPSSLLETGSPGDAGLWSETLDQLFGSEYPFPLVNTNVPAHSQPRDYGLQPSLFLSPTEGSSPQSASSPTVTESSEDDELWLSQIIGDSSAATPPTTYPVSPTHYTNAVVPGQVTMFGTNSSDMVQLAKMPTTGHPLKSSNQSVSSHHRPTLPGASVLSSASVSSRTVNLLQEMKAKNERLERLLRDALADIKELKRRESMREHEDTTLQSLIKLHNIGPADEFRRGVPALAMIALSAERHGTIIQANESFKNLVGYSFEQLADASFTCCKLFPQRMKAKLVQDYADIMSGIKSSGQDDLVFLRGDGHEVPVRAFYHIIYDDRGRPLYKMFYAFPLV